MTRDLTKNSMLSKPGARSDTRKRRPIWRQVVGSVVAATGVFSSCSLLGFGSILLAQLDEPGSSLEVTQTLRAWLMSSAYMGSVAGCCLATLLVKNLGPSRIICWHTIPNLLGWGLVALAHGFWPLVAGRFVCGLACGTATSAVQMYISETTSPRIRGAMLLMTEAAATTSLLVCYLLGLLLPWRTVAIICGLAPNIVMFAGFLWLPESPTWLVHRHRLSDAANSIAFFYGPRFDADQHVQGLVDGMEKTRRTVGETFRLLGKVEYLRPMLISSVQMSILNFCGMNAMLGYAVLIFRLANAGIDEYYCAILLAGVRLLCNIASSSLIDRVGRRLLLSVSGAVSACSLAVIGGFFYAREHTPQLVEDLAWLPLVGMLVTICSFGCGIGPVSWVVFGEILPSAVRELCGTIVMILWTLTLFIILQVFPDLQQLLGSHGLFWAFSAVCMLQLLFAVFVIPETRLRTLEDIHREHFSKRERKAVDSSELNATDGDTAGDDDCTLQMKVCE